LALLGFYFVERIVAYSTLSERFTKVRSTKTIVISTMRLCGFCHFSTIASRLRISALGARRLSDLSKSPETMFGGALASWLTAVIAGLLL
jgi:CNT family concentrative nucleoside transporter